MIILNLILFIQGMEHPVEFGCEAKLVWVIELLAKVPKGNFIALINLEGLSQEQDVIDRLQFGHITCQHQSEQVNDEMRVASYDHVSLLTHAFKVFKLIRLNRILMPYMKIYDF